MKPNAVTVGILCATTILTLAVVARAFGQTAPVPQPMTGITLEFARAIGAPVDLQPAQDVREIEKLPGLYKVAGDGGRGWECNVYLALTPEPVLIDCGSRVGWNQLMGNLKLAGVQPGLPGGFRFRPGLLR